MEVDRSINKGVVGCMYLLHFHDFIVALASVGHKTLLSWSNKKEQVDLGGGRREEKKETIERTHLEALVGLNPGIMTASWGFKAYLSSRRCRSILPPGSPTLSSLASRSCTCDFVALFLADKGPWSRDADQICRDGAKSILCHTQHTPFLVIEIGRAHV